MRKYRKRSLSVISCLVFIALIYSNFPGAETKCEDVKPEEFTIQQVFQHLKDKQVALGDKDLRVVANTIWRESKHYNLDYRLVLALIEVESNYKHKAISPDGSMGLMQLKPSTARVIAQEVDMPYNGSSDLFDPRKNIRIGVYYLSKLIDDFKSIQKALYAYNVGPTRAKQRMAKLRTNKKETHSQFTRRVMIAFQNNRSALPAF
jgi:soluble lytic murein transglycosylase